MEEVRTQETESEGWCQDLLVWHINKTGSFYTLAISFRRLYNKILCRWKRTCFTANHHDGIGLGSNHLGRVKSIDS